MMFPNNDHTTSAGDAQLVVGSTGRPQYVANDNENVLSYRDDGDCAKIHWASRIQSNKSTASSTLPATNTTNVPLNLNNSIPFYAQPQYFDMNNASDDTFALESVNGNDHASIQRFPTKFHSNRPLSMHCFGVNAKVGALILDQSQGIGPTSDGYREDMRADDCKIVPVAATASPRLGEANSFIISPPFNAQEKRVIDLSNGATLCRPEMAHNYDASQLVEMSFQNEFGHRNNVNCHTTNEPMFSAQLARFGQERLHDKNDAKHCIAVNDNQDHLKTSTDDFTFNQPMVSQGMTGVLFHNQTVNSPSYRDNLAIFNGTMSNQSETYVNDGLNFGKSIRMDAAPCTSSMMTKSAPLSFTMLRSQPQMSSHVNPFIFTEGGITGLTASSLSRQGELVGTSFATAYEADWSNQPLPAKSQSQATVKQNFVLKIMKILSVKECQSAIRWTPAGDAFCVLNAKELVEKVLPKYFKETKYTSFTRKLNRWGFKNCTPMSSNRGQIHAVYCHELFLRDRPGLCEYMKAGQGRKSGSTPAFALRQPDACSFQRSGQSQTQRHSGKGTSIMSREVGSKDLSQNSGIQPYSQTIQPVSDLITPIYANAIANPNTLQDMSPTNSEFPRRNNAAHELFPYFFHNQFSSDMVFNEDDSKYPLEQHDTACNESAPGSKLGAFFALDQSRQSLETNPSNNVFFSSNIQKGKYGPLDAESAQNHSWSQDMGGKN